MTLVLILGGVALIGAAFATVLLLAVVGIRRGDRGKRLTGRPASQIEAFSRRLLTGSRGYDRPGDTGGVR